MYCKKSQNVKFYRNSICDNITLPPLKTKAFFHEFQFIISFSKYSGPANLGPLNFPLGAIACSFGTCYTLTPFSLNMNRNSGFLGHFALVA